MTKIRASYVCENALCEYSNSLGLNQYIRVGHGEEKEGGKKEAVFEEAKACLEKFMATQGVESVTITLSEDKPRQNQNSGKFKHIINVQSETKVL